MIGGEGREDKEGSGEREGLGLGVGAGHGSVTAAGGDVASVVAVGDPFLVHRPLVNLCHPCCPMMGIRAWLVYSSCFARCPATAASSSSNSSAL